jgi:hypothetical protein
MEPPLIRHVRYEDFYSLASAGVADLAGFRAEIDALVREMGNPEAHHVLLDLRRATLGPIPESALIEALAELRRRGLGVANRVAIVAEPADVVRWDRAQDAEGIAARAALALRRFSEYDEALDWLSDPDPGA